jgi:hypothetical protein
LETFSVLGNNLFDNALRFHVETQLDDAWWTQYLLLTYENKIADTHNAMNTETGLFTAPFSGIYGFLFYAYFDCDSELRNLSVEINGARLSIFGCQTDSVSHDYVSRSIYFAYTLMQGGTVGIYTDTAKLMLYPHPAKFTGFLLQKI